MVRNLLLYVLWLALCQLLKHCLRLWHESVAELRISEGTPGIFIKSLEEKFDVNRLKVDSQNVCQSFFKLTAVNLTSTLSVKEAISVDWVELRALTDQSLPQLFDLHLMARDLDQKLLHSHCLARSSLVLLTWSRADSRLRTFRLMLLLGWRATVLSLLRWRRV